MTQTHRQAGQTMTEAEWNQWKGQWQTQEALTACHQMVEKLKDEWASGVYGTHEEALTARGRIWGLAFAIAMTYEDYAGLMIREKEEI